MGYCEVHGCYHFKLYGMEVRNVLGEWVTVKYTAAIISNCTGWKLEMYSVNGSL